MLSPIKAETPAPALDQSRMHRLETLDRAGYVRLTGTQRPQPSQALATTLAAVRAVLLRASSLLGLSVPPVIRHVDSTLSDGQTITDEQWNELDAARLNATLYSAAQRPGRLLDSEGASTYARAYHNLARATELLAMCRGGDSQHAEIAYLAKQIEIEAQLWPAAG